jgi:hypothetical protein
VSEGTWLGNNVRVSKEGPFFTALTFRPFWSWAHLPLSFVMVILLFFPVVLSSALTFKIPFLQNMAQPFRVRKRDLKGLASSRSKYLKWADLMSTQRCQCQAGWFNDGHMLKSLSAQSFQQKDRKGCISAISIAVFD